MGIDFDPGPNGVVGQIINFGRDEEKKYIFAKSLDDFLLRLRELLDHKGVRLQDSGSGGYTLNDLHFSDALKHVIYPEVTMSPEEMEVKEEDGFLSVWVFKNQDDEVPDNYFERNKVDGKYQVSFFDKDFRIDANAYSATESTKLESGSSTKIEALLQHNQFSDKFLEKAVVNASEHNIEEVQGVLTIMNLKYDPELSGYHESKYLSFVGSYKVFEPRRW